MDDEVTSSTRVSKKSKKMENTPKPNNGSKVKLKVVKKKVNLRRPNGLNRSNSSFNTSLNASMRMKQSLTTNNRALAQALQLTKQDLALATDLIASLKKENKDLMMEKAEINHLISQGIDVQVNEKLKPVLVIFKTKIREVSNRLGNVASAMKDLSSCVSSQFNAISNSTSTSNPNSRINSLETYQELPTPESTKMPPSEPNDSPKRRRSSFCPPAIQNNGASFNDLSLIAESSFLNLDSAQNAIDVMDMVLENEPEKCKEMSDEKLVGADKPPQRVPVEARRSRSRRDSKSRRQSMDEIDFGPNVVKSRKCRRSSFFLPLAGLEKVACPTVETALENDKTGSSSSSNEIADNGIQDSEVQDNEMVETEQLLSPTLLKDDDDDVCLRGAEPVDIDPTMENEMNEDPPQAETTQSNSPLLFPESPTVQQQQQQQQHAPVSVVVDVPLVTPKTLPLTQAEQIDRTVINEEDMELTEVFDASLQLNVEISSLPNSQSTKNTEGPVVQSTENTEGPVVQSTENTEGLDVESTNNTENPDVESTKNTEKPDVQSTKNTEKPDVQSTKSTKKPKEHNVQSTKETEKPVDTKENVQNEDTAFVKPVRAPKKKTESKKDEKKQTKKTKENMKESSTEDESKAVVELRLPKPGKIIFSAVRKNIAGVRPSPPKARSKKKLAEMKRDELAAEPKNLFDFHDKTPQMLAKKPEAAETGIYDVSLNDSVYGTCQSLGEYRERVAMAKRISSVHTGEAPLPEASSSSTDAAQTEVNDGNGGEPAVEAVSEDASTKSAEEKKKRVRSRKVAADVKEEKKKRARSKKRAAASSDSDSDGDGERTYVKHYQQTVKSCSPEAAPEREFTRRARSRVINYKEEESDFDMTLIEKKTPVIPSKKIEEKQKEKEDSSSGTKDEKTNRKSAPNAQDNKSKNDPKKEIERKSMKGTYEKRSRSRKKSVAAVKNVDDQSDHPLSEGGGEISVPENSDPLPKSSTQSGLQNLISQIEKLQKKCSRPQQSEEETQNPSESTSKPKSSCADMFERYKKALAMSSDTDSKSESKQRQNSKSRSRPARNESSDERNSKNDRGRSRSLHARKISDKMDDTVKSLPERKRSDSVNEKELNSNESSSPVKKQEESPEARKKKTERGRSKSRARSSARSKSKVLEVRSTSPEKKPEESPETLQRKIRKERGRSRSKAAVAKNDDTDNKVLTSDHSHEVEPEVDSDNRKSIRSRSVARRELLAKLKSSNADKENKATTDTNVQNLNMDAARKSESNITTKEVKSLNGHNNQTSDSLKTISTNVPVKSLTVSPRRSSEKKPGKRSSELTTDENQDLKRPRRATKPMSYKEPSIMTKLRQGDKLFGEVPVKRISSGQGNFSTMFDEEPRKRSILENVTNVNC